MMIVRSELRPGQLLIIRRRAEDLRASLWLVVATCPASRQRIAVTLLQTTPSDQTRIWTSVLPAEMTNVDLDVLSEAPC